MQNKFKVINAENREEWLKNRAVGIGGSDASALVGLNPYKSNLQLWQEKMGIKEPDDISDKPAVKYGSLAEKYLRELFALDFPEYIVEHEENVIFQSLENEWMLYSPDGVLTDRAGRKGLLEVKTTTIQNSKMLEAWNDRVPEHYYIQVLHGLLVTGYDFIVLKAQLKSEWNNELRITTKHYFIESKDVIADLMWLLEEEKAVYGEYYLTQKQPPLKINFNI